jgi:hypothetical protein
MSALRVIFRVTRAYVFSGIAGGFVLGGGLPLVLIPLTLLNLLQGKTAEIGTVTAIAFVGALTGGVVGLVVGLLSGVLAGLGTLLFFHDRTGTRAHRGLLRLLTVTTAALLIFFGVTLFTGSTDMSAQTVLIWRLPPALVAGAYGWWLSGRMARHDSIWHPGTAPEDVV